MSTEHTDIVGGVHKNLLIGGHWRPGSSGRRIPVEDPATGAVVAEVVDASPDDAREALDAAEAARAGWAGTSPRRRSELLRASYEALCRHREELAVLLTLEVGKPLAEARAEVAYAADFFRWFAEEAVRIDGRYSMSPDGDGRVLVMRQPVGPCLLITPWNFPLAMATRKVGPALAAGCTMVLKPSELTPLTTLYCAQLLAEAGLPDGVLNIVTTSDPESTVVPLIGDRRLRKVSFTGSTVVGRHLASVCSEHLVRVSTELGGNAPFIVFDDADLDLAIEGAMIAKMRNCGETCTAGNRFLVHARVADELVARLSDRMSSLAVGHGLEPGVDVGPLINERQRARVGDLVDDAVGRGATVRVGGKAIGGSGYFFAPTVLEGVAADSLLLHREIFGPVAPVVTFESEDEVLALANGTDFGLAAYLFTNDLNRSLRMAEALESGMVGLNTGMLSNAAAPFGGIKQSGTGREGGLEGIDAYLETKYVAIGQPRR